MFSHRCAFCGNQTHFTARSCRISGRERAQFNLEGVRHSGFKYSAEIAATCDSCHRYNTATGDIAPTRTVYDVGAIYSGSEAVKFGENMTNLKWSPPSMVQADTEFLPDGVAGFLQEAHDAHSIGAHRAVLLLVRSVIEATAKDKGITSGQLFKKIDHLHADGHIRTGTKEMAHALRILGNDMAHGDIDALPDEQDARDALTIVRFVLDDVYVADARRADILARHEAKLSATDESEGSTETVPD